MLNSRNTNPGLDEYIFWLDNTHPDERNKIAQIIEDHPITSYADIGLLAKVLLAHTIRGNISPQLAETTLKFVKTIIGTHVLDSGGIQDSRNISGSQSNTVLIEQVTKVKQLLTARPQYMNELNVLDQTELIKIDK